MKFRYRSLPANNPVSYLGTSFIRPIISVTLKSGRQEIRYAALIDSGADFCIFDAEIGEAIGLAIKDGKEVSFGGIQDRTGATGYFHPIRIEVGGWEFPIQAAFSYDIAAYGHGVLGQKGFFDLFPILFDYKKGIVEIKAKAK